MPLISVHKSDPNMDMRQSETAMRIRTGVIRGLADHEILFLPELTLSNGRRADLIGLGPKGEIIIVEIKSSVEDYNVDKKWHEYKQFCDKFYFATCKEVPVEIFPREEGFILADEHGCEILRDAEIIKLSPARRKEVTLRFARLAARKLENSILLESRKSG